MRNLSLKGIARRYLNETGNISVRNDVMDESGLFWDDPMNGSGSLRNHLENHAREEVSFSVSECVFGWTAAYEQVWTHITVRVDLNPASGISNATMASLRTTWANTIEQRWSDNWASSRSGELPCPFTFEVQWNTENDHHSVQVQQGSGRANKSTWFVTSSGAVAAHEYGHMIGHEDEYSSSRCPDRSPVNTGTIMDNNSANVPARLIRRFANPLRTGLQTA
jgi:hypothetical protein